MKRLLDIFLASIALVLTAPALLVVACAVYAHDRGPVFFRQTRVGLGGRTFGMFKFRSMVVDAEQRGGYSTSAGDSRITRVGRFIRRTSLDELPQILNVFMGDMSIVGPRPDVPGQRELYDDKEWELRHLVRPGITGLAQAMLRSEATVDQRKTLDLQYARESSLRLDFFIIGLTFRQIFGKGGN
jgi:lipopolysaccharide/colanic/teichoic acid biosynthesis glycosyltransferase